MPRQSSMVENRQEFENKNTDMQASTNTPLKREGGIINDTAGGEEMQGCVSEPRHPHMSGGLTPIKK